MKKVLFTIETLQFGGVSKSLMNLLNVFERKKYETHLLVMSPKFFWKMKTTFSKDDTLAVKGVAILFMIFAHLFNNLDLCNLCTPQLYICDEPLCHILIFGMNPVDFFIVLSGYGLFITFTKGGGQNGQRVLKLYIHYWLVLCVFVTIGYLMGKEGYPGNLITFVENMAGWRNTYNHETWFLLPYSLLALSATCLFRISNQMKPWLLFLIVFSIYLIVRFLSRFDGGLIRNYQLLRWLESFLTLL